MENRYTLEDLWDAAGETPHKHKLLRALAGERGEKFASKRWRELPGDVRDRILHVGAVAKSANDNN